MDKIDLDNEGYCIDCEINHNCSNCDRMKIFLNTFKKVKSNSYKIIENTTCDCWNKKKKWSIMCKKCYWKNKANKNF